VSPWEGRSGMPPVYGGSGNYGQPRLGIPGIVVPHVPTAQDLLNDVMGPTFNDPNNGILGMPRQGGFQPWKPATHQQIPPEVLKIEVPKFEMLYPYPKPTSGDSPRRDESFQAPSWLRWEVAAGIFALSLVAGLLRGYLSRKQAGV